MAITKKTVLDFNTVITPISTDFAYLVRGTVDRDKKISYQDLMVNAPVATSVQALLDLKQPLHVDLTAIAGQVSAGFLKRVAAGSYTAQAIAISDVTALQDALDDKISTPAPITAGTHTKITYDANGIITAGEDLAIVDVPSLPYSKISDFSTGVLGVSSLGLSVVDLSMQSTASILDNLGRAQGQLDNKQTFNTSLSAIAGLSSSGLIVKHSGGAIYQRELATGNASIAVTNSTGVGGNPTVTHATTDGYHHVPATGTGNNLKVLQAGATAGSEAWTALQASNIANFGTSVMALSVGTLPYSGVAMTVDDSINVGLGKIQAQIDERMLATKTHDTLSGLNAGSYMHLSAEQYATIATLQAQLDLKQIVFPGICQHQYLTENDVALDCTGVLPRFTIATVRNGTTITALNPICFYTDGTGTSVKHTFDTSIFVEFTYTEGVWYFYFDMTGVLVADQIGWTDFDTVCPIYRMYLNATLSGANRDVTEAVEFHKNDSPWVVHAWQHAQGSVYAYGLDGISNILASNASGVPLVSPNANGTNTCLSVTSGVYFDDNMPITVLNSLDGSKFSQDLGDIVPATMTALNAGLFKVSMNDSAGRLLMLPATRFPFPWDVATNRPEFISATGVRTLVTDNNWIVNYVYAFQDPRYGEVIRVRSEVKEFATYTNAQASSWESLQAIYPTLRDKEIRPLYKLIHYVNWTASPYDVGCKYAGLVRMDDIRTLRTAPVAVASGSIPLSSTTFVPSGNIIATNGQSAIEELDAEKLASVSHDASLSGLGTAASLLGLSGEVITDLNMSKVTDCYLTVGAPTGTKSTVVIQGLTATEKRLLFGVGTNARWGMVTNADAESTGNAGSSFSLKAYTDGGVLLETIFTAVRATGGNLNIFRPIDINQNITISRATSPALTSGAITSTNAQVIIRSTAGTQKIIRFRTADLDRWTLVSNATAEGGANSGSDFEINAYTDSGVLIDSPITIPRAAGSSMRMNRPVALTSAESHALRSVATAGATTTPLATDYMVVFTGTTTQTYTLPATGATARQLIIKNRSTGIVTVNRAGSDTIDGGTTFALTANQSITLVNNGTDWLVV